jgi:methionyl-tRNA formyltransferase
MNLVFAGTPRFAAAALDALAQAGHHIPLVLTQPDRPAGRGMKTVFSDVKQTAIDLGLTVFQPATLKDDAAVARLAETRAQVMVVAAYGLILPQRVLDLFPLGCLNIHASLLPRWRGAAPIQRALLAGDAETGICIMQMEAGLDTGPVLERRSIPIASDETGASLLDRLTRLGAESIVDVLARREAGPITATPQDDGQATYAAKITRADAAIDWNAPALQAHRVIRTFDPAPGAFGTVSDTAVKLFRAEVRPEHHAVPPGTVLTAGRDGIDVACGNGTVLRVTELQRPGGKRLPAREFLTGFPLQPGERFHAAPGT